MPILQRLKLATLVLAATGAIATLGGCATNPVTGGTDIVTMSEAQEIEIGRKSHPQILQQYGRFEDEQLQQYVNEVGQRIAVKSHRPEPAVHLHRARQRRGQRVRAARRLRLHHARHHELTSIRRPNWPQCWATRSAT